MAGTVIGPAAIVQVWADLFNSFPDLVIASGQPLIDGDRVAELAVLSGTDTGGFMGLPPTGKHAQLPVVTLFTVHDHHFVDVRPIYDFTGLLVQIGVLRPRPA
jgi:predicted ester cyclase